MNDDQEVNSPDLSKYLFPAGFSERRLKDVLGNGASSVAETPQQYSTANERLKKSSEEESNLSAK